jgi:hypothetical protein
MPYGRIDMPTNVVTNTNTDTNAALETEAEIETDANTDPELVKDSRNTSKRFQKHL